MKKKKHLFVCSTPIQLVTAINLKLSTLRDDDATLYVFDHSDVNRKVYNELKKEKLFTEIFYLKTKSFNQHWLQKYRMTRYFVNIIMHLNYEKTFSKLVSDMRVYDVFWTSYMDRASQLFFLTHKKRNRDLDLYYFEDGLGSYGMLNTRKNSLKQKIFHILGIDSSFAVMHAMYVYEPILVLNKQYPTIQIKALPKLENNQSIKKVLNIIFSFNQSDLELLNYRYIIFDTAASSKQIQASQRKLFDFMTDKVGSLSCIKLHPRTNFQEVQYKGNISKVKAPIEMLCINTNVSQKVFISIISTAGTTPKLMFGQEPVVIFLYKLVGLELFSHLPDEYFEFIENFGKTYKNKNRVFLPESLNELEKILQNLIVINNSNLEIINE